MLHFSLHESTPLVPVCLVVVCVSFNLSVFVVPVYLTAVCVVSLYLSVFVVPVFLIAVCVVFQFTFLWYQFTRQYFVVFRFTGVCLW